MTFTAQPTSEFAAAHGSPSELERRVAEATDAAGGGWGGLRPYYDAEGITLFLGDCREILPSLDIAPVVLVTDPPYSSGGFQESGKSGGSLTGRHKERGESIALDNLSTRGYQRLMREVLRSCWTVDEAYIFTDWRMWIHTSDALEDGGWRVRNMLVWDKGQMGMGMPWRNQHELVAYAKRTAGMIMDGKRGNVLNVKRSGNKMHPTEKPLDLCLALLDNSQPGLVIDPFAGSGTTLVAAKLLGRKAIGIEMDERHAETAASRCSQDVLPLSSAGGGVAGGQQQAFAMEPGQTGNSTDQPT